MKASFAVLYLLAGRPGFRASVDDLRHEVAELVTIETPASSQYETLGDVDIIQSGFVVRDGAALQLSETGRSFLAWLDCGDDAEPAPPVELVLNPFAEIDSLVGADTRLKIFDLDLRPQRTDLEAAAESGAAASAGEPTDDDDAIDPSARQVSDQMIKPTHVRPFMALPRFAAAPPAAFIWMFLRSSKSSVPSGRIAQGLAGATITVLGLMIVVATVVTALALKQVYALQSDILALRHELGPSGDRIARLEQSSTATTDASVSDQNKSDAAQSQPAEANWFANSLPLSISPEEAQIVREYVRAPPSSVSAPPIKVGDAITAGTIALPPQLIEKIPKLAGSSFAIGSGTIIIVRPGSQQADVVLSAN